jgi:beta-fructofuranosidase
MTLLTLLAAVLLLGALNGAAETRDALLATALARWRLGDRANETLAPTGSIETGIEAQGEGAIPGAKVARMTDAWFDAGKGLSVKGSAITAYLRARDPRGQWAYALFSKRGGHEIVNFNLFSVDLGGTPGPDIGFEVHTERGFVMVSFPVSDVAPAAWHDLIGRYDARTIEIICDGRIMAKRRWKGGNLTQNDEPALIGGETDQGKIVRPFTGEMEEAALWARALSDEEVALLSRKPKLEPGPPLPEPYVSPIHYRPDPGTLADTIPFYWNGEYHVFYLLAGMGGTPWAHIVSRDLIHWKDLPLALPLGKPEEPDGGNVFTGSVIARNGAFHIFYTGFNPDHPGGREQIMHATSPDLIRWTKHPEQTFHADGVHYQFNRGEDFRDAFVFWNEEAKEYWMLLCARDARTGAPVTGVAVSTDMKTWRQAPPLVTNWPGAPECPDLFRIGKTWYLISSPSVGSTVYRTAADLRGPWSESEASSLDTPILYAAKRMHDGRRHILTGWIRDLAGERDGGGFQWGGHQSVPREVYAGPGGLLFSRPVPEAVAVFTEKVFDLKTEPAPETVTGNWVYAGNALAAEGAARCRFPAPANYMLTCKVRLEPGAAFVLTFREQDALDAGYRLILRPALKEAEIMGPGFRFPRRCPLDASKPLTVRAFVQGTIIECFVNDAFAFSARAYNFREGKLGLAVEGGRAEVLALQVRTHE